MQSNKKLQDSYDKNFLQKLDGLIQNLKIGAKNQDLPIFCNQTSKIEIRTINIRVDKTYLPMSSQITIPNENISTFSSYLFPFIISGAILNSLVKIFIYILFVNQSELTSMDYPQSCTFVSDALFFCFVTCLKFLTLFCILVIGRLYGLIQNQPQ